MINEKMQNDAWTSLPKDFKDEIKKVYNRACYSMAALNVNNTYVTVFKVNGIEYKVVANDKTKSIMFYETKRITKRI